MSPLDATVALFLASPLGIIALVAIALPVLAVRARLRRRAACPHPAGWIDGIYGDAINYHAGHRLWCGACRTVLPGPVAYADVAADHDPDTPFADIVTAYAETPVPETIPDSGGQWWNQVGLHTWTHPFGDHSFLCLQQPDTGDRHILRDRHNPALAALASIVAAGTEPTIPCPFAHDPDTDDWHRGPDGYARQAWPENVWPTAQQWATWFRHSAPNAQYAIAEKVLKSHQEASDCFIRNHTATAVQLADLQRRYADQSAELAETREAASETLVRARLAENRLNATERQLDHLRDTHADTFAAAEAAGEHIGAIAWKSLNARPEAIHHAAT